MFLAYDSAPFRTTYRCQTSAKVCTEKYLTLPIGVEIFPVTFDSLECTLGFGGIEEASDVGGKQGEISAVSRSIA